MPRKKGRNAVGSSRGEQNERALRHLTELCDTLGPGARLPLHKELMQRFEVSERAILRALDDLQRTGRLTRKQGLGTIVTDTDAFLPEYEGEKGTGKNTDTPLGVTSTALAMPPTIIAVASVDHSFFDRCLTLLCSYADEGEFSVLCKPLLSIDESLLGSLGSLVDPAGQHGFMLFNYSLAPLAKQLRDKGAKVVLVGTPPVDAVLDGPCVYGNQEYGGALVTRHLIELGHRKIAFVYGQPDIEKRLRWHGHQRALREARKRGVDVTDSLIQPEWVSDPAAATAFFQRPDAPTALIAWNDPLAIHLISTLQRAGIRVPEDVSIIGYDDFAESKNAVVPLTTVDPFIEHQLRAAVNILSQPDLPGYGTVSAVATVIIPALITRASTASPPRVPS